MGEQFLDMSFPLAGIDNSHAFSDQQPKQLAEDLWGRTCILGENVRGYEGSTGRLRGGRRAGLAKYVANPVVADWIVQEVALLITEGTVPAGGGVAQLNQSGRVVTLVAVSQGNVYTAVAGASSWTIATNGTAPAKVPPLNFTGVMFSTALNQKLWFADGVNYCYLDPSVNTVYTWKATAGTLPVDTKGNLPRLICTWRGRIVMSGLIEDPQNWFMSAVGAPHDWDYAPVNISPIQAVAGNNSPMGIVGDCITALIPYTDDVLVVGGDHTIWQITGDPMAGGQIDLVSDSIGMAWGMPWAKDPYGTVYFFSNRTGIYSLRPPANVIQANIGGTAGAGLQRISQQIEQSLQAYNTGETTIRMMWNDQFQGLHIFLSPTVAPAATTHFFWELRTGAWWTDSFANTNYDPLCCCVFDGNLPGDRVALIGSWDGYVRYFSTTAANDDGTTISSAVVIGPLTSKNLDELLIKDLQAVLGINSGDVSYAVYTGATAEGALATTPVTTGTWSAGRNLNTFVRQSGHALYVKLSSTNAWSMEVIRARMAGLGKVRRRSF